MSNTLAQGTDELRKLILENPKLPIVILVNEDSVCADYGWTYCSSISVCIDEILDCDYHDYDGCIFNDRDRLEEYIEDTLYNEYHEKSDEEYDNAIRQKLAELEPYWKKVIAIYATN